MGVALAGPVALGAGRTATAVTAGRGHAAQPLDDATVRCWRYGDDDELGHGTFQSIGDDKSPASVGPVDLGAARRRSDRGARPRALRRAGNHDELLARKGLYYYLASQQLDL